MLSRVRLLPVRHVEPFALLFQNLRHRAAFHAPLICDIFLPNSRVLLVVEADLLTLVIEEPLFAGLADEFLEGFSCRVFEKWPIKFGPYASPFGETSDSRADAVRRRDGTGAERRTGK